MADLKTKYLGLELNSPLVASASALSKKLEHIKQMEDVGLGAVVLYSLFEEQIIHDSLALDHFLTRGTESFAEAITYFPELETYNTGPENYLKLISQRQGSGQDPHHRQPERRFNRRVDQVRQNDRGSRRGCP